MKIGDLSAFPSEQHETNDGTWNQTYDQGMTYRMWLVGQIATGAVHGDSNEATAKWVVNMADAIIKRLEANE